MSRPQIVVIGGGTGMPIILRGIKSLPVQLTALVTVSDDGGSTGRLREDLGIPAPGDIRNVIAALSEAEPMLLELFQHRFNVSNGLSGHSLGNLLLAAMSSLTGDFTTGIQELSRVFHVKGTILPISNDSVSLYAKMDDGTIVSGESNIPLAHKRIKRIYLKPQPVKPSPLAVQAIKQADLVVISPGSLYTSILPNLIIPQIGQALKQCSAKIVYVCNVMTQAGETTDYSASDHIQAIHDHIGGACIDGIIVHNQPIKETVRNVYAKENATPVMNDIDVLRKMGIQVIEGDIVEYKQSIVRHNTKTVAQLLYNFLTD